MDIKKHEKLGPIMSEKHKRRHLWIYLENSENWLELRKCALGITRGKLAGLNGQAFLGKPGANRRKAKKTQKNLRKLVVGKKKFWKLDDLYTIERSSISNCDYFLQSGLSL